MVKKYINWLREFIATQVSNYSKSVYNWVIEYKGQVIGSISVVRADEKNESCEIGYCIGYAFWNIVIMTEAMVAVLKFLFMKLVIIVFLQNMMLIILLLVRL